MHCGQSLPTESVDIAESGSDIMPKVFVSYSRNDISAVRAIVDNLKMAYCVDVWIDFDSIGGGEDWRQSIRRGIEVADAVLLMLTPSACASEYVKAEIDFAKLRRCAIVPIKISTVSTDDLEKLSVAHLNYIDFSGLNWLVQLSHGLGGLLQVYVTALEHRVLMVQTWADRRVGDPSDRRTLLSKVLKIYGNTMHPVPEDIKHQCIETAITRIISCDPDIVGIGGKGDTADIIRAGLEDGGFRGIIGYWGHDVPLLASDFLYQYGVSPPY